ncbi:hypothetical protein [Croceicoccus mobilis]|uniref:Uncharacterized protein n=1 Tax=Croceicoccus mobilis TaxID=1703339 RepID=A0A916YRK0_9SPHN|nr:hypothetical protein [Croceicoccus mobilis]GGD58135.1 hypothetical protein GCM10010990_04340 [Croceicoccus mobilis]
MFHSAFHHGGRIAILAGALALTLSSGTGALAQQAVPAAGDSQLTYADIADLALPSPMVVVATVKRMSKLDPERSGPVNPGYARVYVEAQTKSLLAGSSPVGAKLKYLADVKLTPKGRVPKLKGSEVVLFARPVPGKTDELQLVTPDAQVPSGDLDMVALRALLAEKLSPDAPPVVTGVRDALHTPGNLAGEGETQIFLKTEDGSPASIAVVRSPGQAPAWGLSTGELVQIDARPPRPGTLEWYRLACALPGTLPAGAQLSSDPSLRQRASADYALVVQQLGPCARSRNI